MYWQSGNCTRIIVILLLMAAGRITAQIMPANRNEDKILEVLAQWQVEHPQSTSNVVTLPWDSLSSEQQQTKIKAARDTSSKVFQRNNFLPFISDNGSGDIRTYYAYMDGDGGPSPFSLSASRDGAQVGFEVLRQFFGRWRLSLNAMLNQSDSESSKGDASVTAASFLSSGGNGYIEARTPLLRFGAKPTEGAWTDLELMFRISTLIPSLGSSVDNPAGSVEPALQLNMQSRSDDSNSVLFFRGRGGWGYADNTFQSNLQLADNDYWYLDFKVGWKVYKIAALYARYAYIWDTDASLPLRVGVEASVSEVQSLF